MEQKANPLVETVLKPKHAVPPPEGAKWNYIADIYTKWHGSYFYFCASYDRPDPNAPEPHFESRFAGMEYVGQNPFNLSFMRYTGQWVEIHQSPFVDECVQSIQNDPFFSAVTLWAGNGAVAPKSANSNQDRAEAKRTLDISEYVCYNSIVLKRLSKRKQPCLCSASDAPSRKLPREAGCL